MLLLQRVEALAEGEEDPVDVSFLQVEAAGHRSVADALRQQGEGQQDGVGQRQACTSGQSSPGSGALKQACDVLMGGRKMSISGFKRCFNVKPGHCYYRDSHRSEGVLIYL